MLWYCESPLLMLRRQLWQHLLYAAVAMEVLLLLALLLQRLFMHCFVFQIVWLLGLLLLLWCVVVDVAVVVSNFETCWHLCGTELVLICMGSSRQQQQWQQQCQWQRQRQQRQLPGPGRTCSPNNNKRNLFVFTIFLLHFTLLCVSLCVCVCVWVAATASVAAKFEEGSLYFFGFPVRRLRLLLLRLLRRFVALPRINIFYTYFSLPLFFLLCSTARTFLPVHVCVFVCAHMGQNLQFEMLRRFSCYLLFSSSYSRILVHSQCVWVCVCVCVCETSCEVQSKTGKWQKPSWEENNNNKTRSNLILRTSRSLSMVFICLF